MKVTDVSAVIGLFFKSLYFMAFWKWYIIIEIMIQLHIKDFTYKIYHSNIKAIIYLQMCNFYWSFVFTILYHLIFSLHKDTASPNHYLE